MSITGALSNAISGLNVTQRDLDTVAGNIANAETEGFTRKRIIQNEFVTNTGSASVRVVGVERVINEQAQAQLRSFGALNVGSQVTADFLNRLDTAFGEPGGISSIDTGFNQALSSLENLSASPDSSSSQVQAVNDLRVFLAQLNNLSGTVQDLRAEADVAIADVVRQANIALEGIADTNARIIAAQGTGSERANLQDQRDRFIDELAQIIDLEVTELPNSGVRIQTTGGIAIFDNQPLQLSFNQAGTVSPQTTRENGLLSTVSLVSATGSINVDLLNARGLQRGALASYITLRDETLPQIQSQLDAFASQLALSVSINEVAGTDIANGQEIDLAGIQDGNEVSLGFTNLTGQSQSVTLVQVSDASQLPLPQSFTPNPNDIVIGVDFSSPTIAADIQTALDTFAPGNGVSVGVAGTTFQITGAVLATIDELTAGISNTSFTNGLSVPLFEDSLDRSAYTNAPGTQTGFAGRIRLSDEILSDPSLLSRFETTTTNAGDSSRVNFILEQIREGVNTYSPQIGIGTALNPIQTSSEDFLQTIISTQGQRATAAQREADIAEISFNSVQERVQADSGVDINTEISRLIELERSFQANARILSTVQDLFNTLFQAVN